LLGAHGRLDCFSKEISEKGGANLRVCHDAPDGGMALT
jgi:hypothetical protein